MQDNLARDPALAYGQAANRRLVASRFDPARIVPERLDERRFPRGHHWKRNRDHEALVLRVKRAICYGEGVGG